MNQTFNSNDISHTEAINNDLKSFIEKNKFSQIFIVTDETCLKLCYPLIQNSIPTDSSVCTLKTGEKNKSLKSVEIIWNFLIEKYADRNSLIINIGGGIITDMGGFAASVFKRGISFINIPTTLLAQIDASVGGKTGINYNGLKNEIGLFSFPEKVFISSVFLKTLEYEEVLSGFGEMIKHALIFNLNHYKELINFITNNFKKNNFNNFNSLIKKSVNIKEHFVKNDLAEKNLRKTLNFGHTFGHAIESYYFKKEKTMRHGTAIIYGIICDLWLSVKYLKFKKSLFTEISNDLLKIYKKINIPENDFLIIYELIKHDKKNIDKNIQTVLLKDIGKPEYQNIINKNDIIESLQKLNTL